MSGILKEITRRNVHKVAVGYLAVGWLLTEIMGTALPAIGAPEWVAKAILLVFLLGLPFVLWFSWAFEITDDGIKRTHEVTAEESITDRTGRQIDFAIIGVLVIAVGWLLVDKFGGETSAPVAEVADISEVDSIAVLPFEDFSAGGDQQHLAVGLSDSILHMLAQVDGLKVAARTSSFSFDAGTNVREVGEELGVATVLEGSVQRSGDTLRIIAQLVRSSDQSHLWSATFDRPAGDIFAIQDEIANAVVAVLRPTVASTVGSANASGGASIEAFEHYSRGNQLWQRRNLADVESAIEAFQAAIALDPDYADAHAGMAIAYLFSTYYGARETDEVQLIVEQSIDRALALDPDNALAYGARGQLMDDIERIDEAIAAYRRAIELNPNDPYPYVWLSGILGDSTEEIAESNALVSRAYELDPRNAFVMGQYAGMLVNFEGDIDGAIEIYRRGIALEPDAPRPYSNIANLHAQVGRLDDAIRARLAEIERAPESPGPYASIAGMFLDLGDQEAAQEWFAKARERNPNIQHWNYWFIAPEHHDRLIEEAEAARARNDDNENSRIRLARAYMIAGRDDDALETALSVLVEDGGLALATNRWNAIEVAIWLLPEADPRRQEMVDWMGRIIETFVAQGLVGAQVSNARAQLAAYTGDHGVVVDHVREAIELGDRSIRNYRHLPWWRQFAGEPEFDALLAELEAELTRQRNSLRVEGI